MNNEQYERWAFEVSAQEYAVRFNVFAPIK